MLCGSWNIPHGNRKGQMRDHESCAGSGTGNFLRTLLGNLAIDFGPPVVESVNLVLSRYPDNALVARPSRLNFRNNDFFPVSTGLGECPAGHVHNTAASNKAESALFTHAIHGNRKDVVLQAAGIDQILGKL